LVKKTQRSDVDDFFGIIQAYFLVSAPTPTIVKKLGVLGSGQMGGGIAQVAAQAGFSVLLADRDQATAEAGKAKIAAQLKKLVEKAKITGEEVLMRIGVDF
jgi:3-hydroxyacyl-CoA dehydrogenase